MSESLTQDVRTLAAQTRKQNPDWHEGRAVYAALEKLRPDLASAVRGADCDPYYGTSRLPAFWDWLGQQPDTAAAPA